MASAVDLRYVAALVAAVPLALLWRRLPGGRAVRLAAALLPGLATAAVACGGSGGLVHPVAVALVAYGLLRLLGPRHCAWATTLWCFGYLGILRSAHWLRASPPAAQHAASASSMMVNTVLLVMSLKLVGVALDRASARADSSSPSTPPAPLSALEYFGYAFFFPGLLTGPIFSHDVFLQTVRGAAAGDPAPAAIARADAALLRRVPVILISGVCYLLLQWHFPVSAMASLDFAQRHSYAARWLYAVLGILGWRCRYYAGWKIAECACAAALIGAGDEHDSRGVEATITNVDISQVELSGRLSTIVRHWNMSVQRWMHVHVYQRWPWRSSAKVERLLPLSAERVRCGGTGRRLRWD